MAEKTSVPEPNSEIDKLVYVIRDDGNYGGWRTELLVEEMTGKGEGKFLLCNYCRGVLRDACLFEKDGKQELRCSVCIPKDVNKQKAQFNRETVNEKQVYCPLKSKGCGWTNELSKLVHHLEHCVLFSVACPYSQYGCEAKVQRRNLEQHEKEAMHKHMKLTVKEIDHLKKFRSKLIPMMIMTIMIIVIIIMIVMIKENKECPLQETECLSFQHGCEAKVQRRNIEEHDKLIIDNIQSEIITLQKENKELRSNEIKYQNKLVRLEEKNEELRTKIVNLEEKNEEFRSWLQEEKEDMHKHLKLTVEEINHLKRFQTLLIPMISSLGAKGNLEWKISGVKNKISQNEDTYSEPFYVGLYKFQGGVEWIHNENYATLFFCIMKGEWDDTLKWPIRCTMSMVLINQLDAKDNYEKKADITEEKLKKYPECFNKPITEQNRGFGLTEFISHADLLQEKYSKDDSITLKISVELIPSP